MNEPQMYQIVNLHLPYMVILGHSNRFVIQHIGEPPLPLTLLTIFVDHPLHPTVLLAFTQIIEDLFVLIKNMQIMPGVEMMEVL